MLVAKIFAYGFFKRLIVVFFIKFLWYCGFDSDYNNFFFFNFCKIVKNCICLYNITC